MGFERQIRDCLTEPKVLLIQILHPTSLIDLRAAIFLAPPVVGLLRILDPPASLGGRAALAQHDRDHTQLPDDFFGLSIFENMTRPYSGDSIILYGPIERAQLS
jgi:hypothetical protein